MESIGPLFSFASIFVYIGVVIYLITLASRLVRAVERIRDILEEE